MKKPLIRLAAAVTAVVLLAGCSDPGAGSGTTASGPQAWPAQDTKLDGTTLTFWSAQSSAQIPAAVVEGFEKLTGAKVDVVTIPDPYEQSVLTKVATGDKPDLAFWSPNSSSLVTLNPATNLLPMTDAPWLGQVDESVRDVTGLYQDTRYAALVSSPSVLGVYYNKAVLSEAGITTPPTNFAGLVKNAETLKNSGVTPFFEMAGEKWSTQWWPQVQLADAAQDGLWDRVNSHAEKFTDRTIQGAIDTYAGLIADGYFNDNIKTATFDEQADALLSGDAAMAVQINGFANLLATKVSATELDETIGFFPISTDGNLATSLPDQTNAVVAFKTGDEAKEAATRQFMAYWMGQGYSSFIQDQGFVSIEPAVATPAEVPQLQRDLAAALKHAVGGLQAQAVAVPDMHLYLTDMIQGTMTPQQVGEATQAHFEQLAKAQGVSGF